MDTILKVLLAVGVIAKGSGKETTFGGLDVQHRYACVSPESCRSNMYSIECSVGEKIAMLGMNYGAKPYTPYCASPQACVSRAKCCTHEEGDCLVPYETSDLFDLYKKCSQAPQCGWLFAKSTDLTNSCKFRDRSNYVMADFFCVSDTQFIDVCSQHTLTARKVHMHHSAIPPSVYNYQQCSCLITPSDCNSKAKIMFRAIDIRLQTKENLTSCHAKSRVELIGQNGIKRYNCETDKFLHGLKDFYTTDEGNIALYLHKEHRKFPTKLWLEVTASEPGVDIKVTCGPRSLQTARRCPAVPNKSPNKFDEPKDLPNRPDTSPTLIHIDEDDFDPNSPRPDDDGPRDKKNPAIAAILGGVVAGIVVLVLLLVLVCLILRRNRNRKKKDVRYSYKVCQQDRDETHQVNYYETVSDPDTKLDPVPAHGRHPIYHQPWGTQQGFPVSRAKPSDLAYATSEEIKVLIEKMEKDRQFINEGEGELYPAPDPTYYRHIDNYRFRYSGHDPHDGDSDNEHDLKHVDNVEHEAKSNASENSGTEQMGSEDSKVEADRHMDSDIESQKVESEALIQTYYDGYESPRLSTFHPMALPQRNSFNPGKPIVDIDVSVEPKQELIHVDNNSDDIPNEHAPPISAAVKRKDSESSVEEDTECIKVEDYREPDNAEQAGSQEEDAGSCSEEHQYSPVYDEIPENKTDL